MNNPNGYTIPLALEDFVPVLLGALGCYFLARTAASRVPETWKPGLIGVVLVALGGGGKSTWKLIVASGGSDYAFLQQALFPLLAGGFGLVAWALFSGFKRQLLPWWPLATVLAVAWVAADAVRGMGPFFLLTVLTSLFLTGLAITWAVRNNDPLAVIAFVVQLVGVFALVPLQSREVQSLSTQWTEQGFNTVAQAAFVLGSWRLFQSVRRTEKHR